MQFFKNKLYISIYDKSKNAKDIYFLFQLFLIKEIVHQFKNSQNLPQILELELSKSLHSKMSLMAYKMNTFLCLLS